MSDSFTGALLDAWERGRSESRLRRPLTLLAAVHPGLRIEEGAGLPIARRDALLLGLRSALFGAQASGQVRCPACSERLHVPVDLNVLARAAAPSDDGTRTERMGSCDVVLRWPTTSDLELATAAADAAAARETLLLACVVEVRSGGHAVPRNAWPPELPAQVSHWLARNETLFDVTCTACGHQTEFDFDIGAFLWREVDAWARRRLYEVHRLARSYGWSEAEILGLSAARRQAYLELVDA